MRSRGRLDRPDGAVVLRRAARVCGAPVGDVVSCMHREDRECADVPRSEAARRPVREARGAGYVACRHRGSRRPGRAAGSAGPAGSRRPRRLRGLSGCTGRARCDGRSRIAWAVGRHGPQGPQGLGGVTGVHGVTGATGAWGATGPQGIQGPVGVTGPQGPRGVTGAHGVTGATGLEARPDCRGLKARRGRGPRDRLARRGQQVLRGRS
jgi:hypothetical protein